MPNENKTTTELVAEKVPVEDRPVSIEPFGRPGKATTCTLAQFMRFHCTPTKTGKTISRDDAMKVLRFCAERGLNPWDGDAYVLGYDGKDGPTHALIVTHAALLKRAAVTPAFNGLEGGVILRTGEGLEYREGEIIMDGETLVGGWARCHMKDRDVQTYEAINLSAYVKESPFWRKDPGGMITKCAKSKAIREAMPCENGELYTEEEMLHRTPVKSEKPKRLSTITQRIAPPVVESLPCPDLEEGERMQADGEVVSTHIYDEPEA